MKLNQYTERIFTGTSIMTRHLDSQQNHNHTYKNYYCYLTIDSIKIGNEADIHEKTILVQKRTIRKYYKITDDDYLWHQDFIVYKKDNKWYSFIYNTIETSFEVLLSEDFIVIRPYVVYLKQLLERDYGQKYIKDKIKNIYTRYESPKERIEKVNSIIISPNFINQDIEFAKEEESSIKDKNIDLSNIRMTQKPISIDRILKRIHHGEINMDTSFQRKTGLWDIGVKSRLIETIILNMPIPAFYFDASEDSKWLVIDGLQRLSAIKEFVLDKSYSLTHLDYIAELEGLSFDEIERKYQRRIEEFDVIAYLIEPGTPKHVKYKIFKNINTSALILEPQEIRHALNDGKAASIVKELSELLEFRKVIRIGSKSKERMLDREIALRFLAFRIFHFSDYTPPMKDFLDKTMTNLKKITAEELDAYKETFAHSLLILNQIFGTVIFSRNMYIPLSVRTYPFNSVLFEIWISAVADLSVEDRERLVEKKTILKSEFKALIENSKEFENSIDNEYANQKNYVPIRFKGINRLIKTVLE